MTLTSPTTFHPVIHTTTIMRAYYYDNIPSDQRLPHDCIPSRPVSAKAIEQLGIKFWHIPVDGYESKVDAIANERGYKNRELTDVSKEGLGEVSHSGKGYSTMDLAHLWLNDRYTKRKSSLTFTSTSDNFFLLHSSECTVNFRHMHEEEEIRYVISGSGFFDVRGM